MNNKQAINMLELMVQFHRLAEARATAVENVLKLVVQGLSSLDEKNAQAIKNRLLAMANSDYVTMPPLQKNMLLEFANCIPNEPVRFAMIFNLELDAEKQRVTKLPTFEQLWNAAQRLAQELQSSG